MDANERLNKAAAKYEALDKRVAQLEAESKELRERQTALEKTFTEKQREILKGYKLLVSMHTYLIEQHNKYLDQLKDVVQNFADTEVKG